jgi:hypothetical protein
VADEGAVRSTPASAKAKTPSAEPGNDSLRSNGTHTLIRPRLIPAPTSHECGAVNCTRMALIWLTDAEEEQTVVDERVFQSYIIEKST